MRISPMLMMSSRLRHVSDMDQNRRAPERFSKEEPSADRGAGRHRGRMWQVTRFDQKGTPGLVRARRDVITRERVCRVSFGEIVPAWRSPGTAAPGPVPE